MDVEVSISHVVDTVCEGGSKEAKERARSHVQSSQVSFSS